MMLRFLRYLGNRIDEIDGLRKIVELKDPLDCLLFQFPFRDFLEVASDGIGIEGFGHTPLSIREQSPDASEFPLSRIFVGHYQLGMIKAYAPGRVELLGNHTDYNQGVVLSAAIDRGVTIEGEALEKPIVRLSSASMEGTVEMALADIKPLPDHAWGNYPLGVLDVLVKHGVALRGFSARISSDLPVGAGLSSSAALEVATAVFVSKLCGLKLERMEMAKLCRKAENEFVGVNCGLLDQVSSSFGQKEHAVFLDCRDESVRTIPIPAGVELLITHSGVKHALVGGEYNERREQCFEAAALLKAPALRDVTSEQLQAARAQLPELVYKRAAHVVGENERVLQGAALLSQGNVEAFGKLMFASHESSRLNFENSTPELDALVQIASEEPDVLGSRLTGGGFGGATVSLVRTEAAARISESFQKKYKQQTGNTCQTYICAVAEGAH